MQHYLYKCVEYKNERELRKAIFEREHKVFGKPKTVQEWAEFGVEPFEIKPVVTKEQWARDIRLKRDALLSKSDFYVMPDYPSTEEALAQVKAYRQALRDITKQEGFPNEIVWPDVPEVLQ